MEKCNLNPPLAKKLFLVINHQIPTANIWVKCFLLFHCVLSKVSTFSQGNPIKMLQFEDFHYPTKARVTQNKPQVSFNMQQHLLFPTISVLVNLNLCLKWSIVRFKVHNHSTTEVTSCKNESWINCYYHLD